MQAGRGAAQPAARHGERPDLSGGALSPEAPGLEGPGLPSMTLSCQTEFPVPRIPDSLGSDRV